MLVAPSLASGSPVQVAHAIRCAGVICLNARLRLSLHTLANCPPCQVVKAALDDPVFAGIGPVEVRVAGIEEMRALRGQEERKLIFPILSAYSGESLLGRRMGMRSAEVAEERRHILEWIEAVRRDPAVDLPDPAR